MLRRICVYCGSSSGTSPRYADAARRLGTAIAAAGLGLVYGGGSSGLMGVLATSCLAAGGHVTGVMPKALANIEHAFREVSEYHEVDGFHRRKALMADLSDAFIALPGGPGTMEELIEQLAHAEHCGYSKPVFLINTDGYWNSLLDLLEVIRHPLPAGSCRSRNFVVTEDPEQAILAFLTLHLKTQTI